MKILIINSTSEEYLFVLKRELSLKGYSITSTDDAISIGESWLESIHSQIRTSDVVILFLSKEKPSTLFEAGLIYASLKPILLVASDDEDIPSTLNNFPMIIKTGNVLQDVSSITSKLNNMNIKSNKMIRHYKDVNTLIGRLNKNLDYLMSTTSQELEEGIYLYLSQFNWLKVYRGEEKFDSGYDIRMIDNRTQEQILVEVKKMPANTYVSSSTVSRLITVVKLHKAFAGILITTGKLTTSANELSKAGNILTLTVKELFEIKNEEDFRKKLKL